MSVDRVLALTQPWQPCNTFTVALNRLHTCIKASEDPHPICLDKCLNHFAVHVQLSDEAMYRFH